MKSSNLLLVAWCALVAVVAFFLVRAILPGDTPPNPDEAVVGPLSPGPETGSKTPGPRHPDGGPAGPRDTPQRRKNPVVLGRVVDGDGNAVPDATVRIALPVESVPAAETSSPEDIAFLYSLLIVMDEDIERPRPFAAFGKSLSGAAGARAGAAELAHVTTGADGRFECPVPGGGGRGPFRVTVESALGKASAQGVQPDDEIELTVGPVAAVTGTVTSGGSNVGVAGAIIVLDDGEGRHTATSAADGSFRIEGVGPGSYLANVAATGQPPLMDATVKVLPGRPLELRLPRGTTLHVVAVLTALDPEDVQGDRPLADAQIAVLHQDTLQYVLGKTDANGVVDFDGLPPGTYSVSGRGARAIPFGEEIVNVTGEQLRQEVELSFDPAVDTEVTVVDEGGAPLAGMTFYTANVDEMYDAVRSVRVPGQTDAQGRFTFPFEFEGPRALLFGFKKGFAMVRVYPESHDEGAPMRVVAHPAVRVHGLVRTPEGTPVPDALVLLDVEPDDVDGFDDDLSVQIRSGPDGRYDFPYLPRGAVYLSAELGEEAWSDDIEIEMVDGKSEYEQDIELEVE